jgi:thiosulfate/3-mercaptopyruvate sulfurtransferase
MKSSPHTLVAFLVLMGLSLMLPSALLARDIPGVVSAEWLEKNVNNPKMKIVDIRKVAEYKEGHVPGSVNVPYDTWAVKKGDLDNEIPDRNDLVDIISSAGITPDSWVLIVGWADMATDLVNQTRVAWTLKYAGLDNVAVLDGGIDKWLADKKPVSTEQPRPKSVAFTAKWNRAILAKRDYVLSKIGKSALIDARMPEYYFGLSKPASIARFGHIESARNLPSAWIYANEGTFNSNDELAAMASGVVGGDKSKEVIVYCDTGRLATGWWWVLSEVLGYKDVKSYDGSSQDWAKDANAPMTRFSWQ